MTVQEAIAAADSVLPGEADPEGDLDERWQAIIRVGEFVEAEPEPVWSFILRWGSSSDDDLRMAIATCVLEHLLEYHFDDFISRVEKAAAADRLFGDMVSCCWKFGRAETVGRAARFDRLLEIIRERAG
jgi:hypothetical protein